MKFYYNSKKNTSCFTNAMKQNVEKTFKSVEKYLKQDEPIKLSLQVFKDGTLSLKCQVVAQDNKHLLAEVNTKDDFYVAVTSLKSKLTRLLNKNKKKKAFVGERPVIETPTENINKFKQIIMDSITPEQAIKEAENLGHNWYVFRNSEDHDGICVVYRRFEGDYGLIACK